MIILFSIGDGNSRG